MAKTAKDAGYAEQAEVLADGLVEKDEYETSLVDLRECIVAKGYVVTEPIVSPVTGTNYEFVYDSNGRDQDQALVDYGMCERKYWELVSAVYVDTAPQRMDAGIRQSISDCLVAKGLETDDSAKSIREFVLDDPSRDLAVTECATDAAFRLFPDLRQVSLPRGPR